MTPKSRKNDLAIQEANGELFIYDLKTDQMYSLNPTSTFVWNHLDGETSVEILARKISEQFNHTVDEDFIWLAIEELRKFNLLDKETAPKAMSKLKRREVIKRIGLATMIALPVISMLVAPTALQAASGGVNVAVCQPCTGTNALGNCAPPGRCMINGDSPQGARTKICSINNVTIFGVFAYVYPTNHILAYNQNECATFGQAVCCRGSATFSNNICRCN